MKKLSIILSVLVLAALLCLSGCVDVATTMTVDQMFAGQRVMTVSFPADQLKTEGGIADVDDLIRGAKPEALSFTRTDSVDPVEYVFTLSFDSLADYEQKVESIIYRDANISFSYVDQPYSQDIRLVEDFDSSDLFLWFDQVINGQKDVIEAAFGRPVDVKNIWTLKGYTLELAGETYNSTNEKISYVLGSGDFISDVEMTTVIHGDEQYTRYIEFKFTDGSSPEGQSAIIERINGLLPEGGSIEQSAGASGASCTVSFTATTTQQLAALTTNVLEGKRATAVWGDVEDDNQPLTTLNGFEETVDLSAFTTDDQLGFVYRVVSEAGMPSGMYSKKSGSLISLDAEINGNTITYSGNGTLFDFYTVTASVSRAQTITYGLVVEGEDEFIREIRITLPAGSEAEVVSQVEAYYADRGAPNTEIITSGSAEQPYVLITVTGDATEICAAEDVLFGVSPERQLSYVRNGGLFKVKPDATLVDSYDITSLLSLTGVSEYIYIASTGDNVYKCSVAEDSNLPTKAPIAVRCDQGVQSMAFTGTYVNADAVIFICLLVVLVLLLAALAVTLYLSKLAEKEAEQEERPAELAEGEHTRALPVPEPRDFIAVMEDPEPIVPVTPVEMQRYEDSAPPVVVEEPEEDMLGIFTGADLGEESYVLQPEPEPELVPIEEPVSEPQPEPQPEPETESEPEPEPEPQPEPEKEVRPVDVMEDRFPMENLPPVIPSPEDSIDKYSDSDFINDLRYLGYLEEYAKRRSRVKVKVRKKSRSDNK